MQAANEMTAVGGRAPAAHQTLPWRPIVDAAAVARTRAAALRLVQPWHATAALAAGCYENALRALVLAYLPEAWYARARAESMRHLEAAIAGLDQAPPAARLHGGITGTAWLISHVHQRLCGPDAGDLVESVDDYVLQALESSTWRGPYDLIDGLVGIGVYAVDRLPRPAARPAITLVLDHLRALAEPTAHGWLWRSAVGEAPRSWGPMTGAHYWDTGMAHGIAGVAAWAAAAMLGGVIDAGAEAIVDQAVAGLTSLQAAPMPLGPFSGFLPVFVTPAALGPAPPVAWCYGAPGWASTLALTGRARGRTDWLQAGATLACQSLAPDQPCAGATLCHGASGLSLIAQRMAQATGLTQLRSFAGVWARRALSLCEADGALDPGVVTEDELLTGRIGATLALLAAATSVEPAWDRLLLLSGRPVP